MQKSFIELIDDVQNYLIETRVAMASLWHQKVIPVVHDVVAYVDMHRMEVSLAVALVAFMFLAGILTYKMFKMRKKLRRTETELEMCEKHSDWRLKMWHNSIDSRNAVSKLLIETRDELVEREDEIEKLTTQRDGLAKRQSELHAQIHGLRVDLANERSSNDDLEEAIESLNSQLEDEQIEGEELLTRAVKAEAANDELLNKVSNLEKVVLRAA